MRGSKHMISMRIRKIFIKYSLLSTALTNLGERIHLYMFHNYFKIKQLSEIIVTPANAFKIDDRIEASSCNSSIIKALSM